MNIRDTFYRWCLADPRRRGQDDQRLQSSPTGKTNTLCAYFFGKLFGRKGMTHLNDVIRDVEIKEQLAKGSSGSVAGASVGAYHAGSAHAPATNRTVESHRQSEHADLANALVNAYAAFCNDQVQVTSSEQTRVQSLASLHEAYEDLLRKVRGRDASYYRKLIERETGVKPARGLGWDSKILLWLLMKSDGQVRGMAHYNKHRRRLGRKIQLGSLWSVLLCRFGEGVLLFGPDQSHEG